MGYNVGVLQQRWVVLLHWSVGVLHQRLLSLSGGRWVILCECCGLFRTKKYYVGIMVERESVRNAFARTSVLEREGQTVMIWCNDLPTNVADLNDLPTNVADLSDLPTNVADLNDLPTNVADLNDLPTNVADLNDLPTSVADLRDTNQTKQNHQHQQQQKGLCNDGGQ